MTHIYTVSFHPPADSWLASARHHDRRIALAELAIDAVSGGDDPALVALPAGFLRASTVEARDRLAEGLLALSRRAQVALLFGVDEASEDQWAPLAGADASFVYGCDSGRKILWPAKQVRASTKHPPRRPPESRCLDLAGERVGLVISAEAFNAPLRLSLAQASPSAILMLAHSPPTDRWSGAMASWNAIAPTFVVAPAVAPRRGATPWIADAPTGWAQDRLAETQDMTIRRYFERPREREREATL